MAYKLSILIPTLTARNEQFEKLHKYLLKLIDRQQVQIIIFADNGEHSIGFKRNWLISMSEGEYTAFIDDDDWVEDVYIEKIMEGINAGVDCCSLRGVITFDGMNPEVFEHSIKYKEYKTTSTPIKYERYPNHLNCIKKEIASQFKFPEINHGEDTDWATQIFNSGLIKTEHYIPNIIYNYNFKTNK